MAIVLIATPGAPNANSFGELTDAEELFEADYYAAPWWAAKSSNEKKQLLIQATNDILDRASWGPLAGYRTFNDQRLPWPRTGAWNREMTVLLDSSTIPQDPVLRAWVAQARAVGLKDRHVDSSSRGIRSVEAGSVAVEFDGIESSSQEILSDEAWSILAPWLENSRAMANSLTVVELVR